MKNNYLIYKSSWKQKYEVTSQPVNGDYYTDGEFIGRYDTKEEALKVIANIELVEGRQYIINYKYPDICADVLDY